jgi:hypothetical protein
MNELVTKDDIRVFADELVRAIRRVGRRLLWSLTAIMAVMVGILFAALRLA